MTPDVFQKQAGNSGRIWGSDGGDSVDPLRQTIHNDENGIVPFGVRKLTDHVHGDNLPTSLGLYLESTSLPSGWGRSLSDCMCHIWGQTWQCIWTGQCRQEIGLSLDLPSDPSFEDQSVNPSYCHFGLLFGPVKSIWDNMVAEEGLYPVFFWKCSRTRCEHLNKSS